MSPLRQRMIEDMQVRNLASATQTTYLEHVYRFARHFHKSPEDLGPEEIRTYQLYLINERGLAPQSALIAVSASAFSIRSR
jgi:integrase/recombinase XerD